MSTVLTYENARPGTLLADLGGLPPRRSELKAAAAAPLQAKPAAAAPPAGNLTTDLARILRPQAAYRWLLPQISAITPAYVEMTLRGALAGNHVQAWELFDLMLDSWPELAACYQELVESVQRKTLIFEPYAEEGQRPTPEAVERMKVVSAALRNMRPRAEADENDLDGTIKDILSGWFIGQVVQEISWEDPQNEEALNTLTIPITDEKQVTTELDIIAPRCTFWVHPVCVAWSMDGTLGLRTEINDLRQATKSATANSRSRSETGGSVWNTTSFQPRPTLVDGFPPNKFLIGINKAKSGTALGGARLRVLAWWWCASNFSAEWLMNLAQLFGLPIRWANYDQNAPQETIDGVCAMLEKMGSAAWGAFPAGTQLNIMDGAKNADHTPQGDLLDRADKYARVLVLGQTMSGSRRGMQGGGGPGFGGVEKDVKEDRVDAAGGYACSVLNLQFIPAILEVNYGDRRFAPSARLLEEEEGTLQDAQRDQALANAGLEIGKNFLRKKYGIPAPEPGEETIGQAKPSSAMPGGATGGQKDGGRNASTPPGDELPPDDQLEARGKQVQHTTDLLVDHALADATGIAPRWLGAVRPIFEELIAKFQDEKLSDHDLIAAIEAAQKKLPDVFDRLDHNALARVIEQTMSAGIVNGAVKGALQRNRKVPALTGNAIGEAEKVAVKLESKIAGDVEKGAAESAGAALVKDAEGHAGRWITLRGGRHIFIREGEQVEDAIARQSGGVMRKEGEALSKNPNIATAKHWADEKMHPDKKNFAVFERSALREYQRNSGPLNNALIESRELNPTLKGVTRDIDSAMEQSKLPQSMTLYHGSKSFDAWNKLEPGQQIATPSYLSTAIAEDVTYAHGRNVVLEIAAPKGAHGIYMDALDKSFQNETEVLLPRGTKLEVVKKEIVDGELRLKFKLVKK